MTGPVLFDASALIALARNEAGAVALRQLLLETTVLTTAVTLAEAAASHAFRTHGSAGYWTAKFADVVAEVISVELADSARAAGLILDARSSGRDGGPKSSLSLGDAVCIAVAERLGVPLVGADRAWGELDLNVEFLPFR